AAAALGFFRDGILRLALGADEQDGAPFRRRLLHELRRVFEHLERLLQVNDVNAVALAEDVFLHLGVPALGLVPEVDARFEQLFHGDVRQTTSLYGLHPPRYCWPRSGLHSCPQCVAGRFWSPKLATAKEREPALRAANTKNLALRELEA